MATRVVAPTQAQRASVAEAVQLEENRKLLAPVHSSDVSREVDVIHRSVFVPLSLATEVSFDAVSG